MQNQEIPKKLRKRDHIDKILQLEKEESAESEKLKKVIDATLKELKKLYESAIKPMEVLYKYRDLSNRHFGGTTLHTEYFTPPPLPPLSECTTFQQIIIFRSGDFLKTVSTLHGSVERREIDHSELSSR